MPYKDLRQFIDKLEKESEAKRIEEEIDWNLEAGAMIRRSNELGLPAPFFQRIRGFSDEYRLFGEVLGSIKRVAIAMDMDRNTGVRELVEEFLRRKRNPIKPVLVNHGSCKENVHLGDDVDLFEFPVPMIHKGDGGRYVGSSHLTICKDPDSGWINWGTYRHMLHNKNTIGLQAGPQRHIRKIQSQSWEPRGKATEVAIAIGVDPVLNLCAATPLPHGVSEVDIASGVRGEPVELIMCETVDLPVPATAEIVIEGEIILGKTMDEGPFGEYTGYIGGHREPRSVIHVKAVTHRNNPILTMGCEGIPTTQSHTIPSITRAAELLDLLKTRGFPITGVSVPVEMVGMAAVVAIKAGHADMVDDIAHMIWGAHIGRNLPWIIFVEDDVDPFNLANVMHAVVSKCHPYRGVVRLGHTSGMALHPWLNRHEQTYMLGAKAYFDCTWPRDWESSDIPPRCSFENIYPLEIKQKVLAVWSKYGY
ncbi:UbiD family decarboxylase [Chloroflexota bacterium]